MTQQNFMVLPRTNDPEGDSGLATLAARMGERLGETAQAIDDVARSTCLLALDAAIEAHNPGNLGPGLTTASREVRRLAEQTYRSLADLESMLKGTGPSMGGSAEMDVPVLVQFSAPSGRAARHPAEREISQSGSGKPDQFREG